MTKYEQYIELVKIRLLAHEFFESEDWKLFEQIEKSLDLLIYELNENNEKKPLQ